MMVVCKKCKKPLMMQPSLKWMKETPLIERLRITRQYVCIECKEKEALELMSEGAEAVTFIEGKRAPWIPFGMDPDPRKFSRGNNWGKNIVEKKEEDKDGN